MASAKRTKTEEGEDLGRCVGASDLEVRRQAASRLSHNLSAKDEETTALKADNAALLGALEDQLLQWSGDQSYCRQCRTTTPQVPTPRVPHQHAARCILAQPRLGTAFLEEHRKALGEKDAAIQSLADVGEELLGGLVLLETDPERAADAIAEASGRMVEALRGAGRIS